MLADPGLGRGHSYLHPQLMTNLAAIAAEVAGWPPGIRSPPWLPDGPGEIEETLTILTQSRLPHYHFPMRRPGPGRHGPLRPEPRRPRYEVKAFADVDREMVKKVLSEVKRQAGVLFWNLRPT